MPEAEHLQDSLAVLKEIACKAFELEEDQVQVWDYHNYRPYGNKPIDMDTDMNLQTVQDQHIVDGQEILLIEKVQFGQ